MRRVREPKVTAGARSVRAAATAVLLGLVAVACTSDPEERQVDSRITPDGDGGVDATTATSTTEPDQVDQGNGSDERITEDGTYSCGDSPDFVIAGSSLEVDLTGSCTSVRLEGSGHDVEIESVGLLTVTGANHEAEVSDAASRIELEGANHDVQYPSDAGTVVDDQSNNSRVEAG